MHCSEVAPIILCQVPQFHCPLSIPEHLFFVQPFAPLSYGRRMNMNYRGGLFCHHMRSRPTSQIWIWRSVHTANNSSTSLTDVKGYMGAGKLGEEIRTGSVAKERLWISKTQYLLNQRGWNYTSMISYLAARTSLSFFAKARAFTENSSSHPALKIGFEYIFANL